MVTELTCDSQRWVWDLDFTADRSEYYLYHQNIYLSDIFSQYVLSASSDSVARLWSLKTGELKREYQAHQKPLTSLAFRDLHGVRNMSS